MPKGITSLLSDGAAKRKDPGVKAPKKAPAPKQVSMPAITRPNAANTRARAAGSLLSKMPKKK